MQKNMSRRRSPLSKKTPNTLALSPKSHPSTVREKVDYDYLAKLSEEEKLWLSLFTDNFIGADYRLNEHNTPEHRRREDYKAKNSANKCMYAHAGAWNLFDREIEITEDVSAELTPEVFNTRVYKDTLATLRQALDTKPKDQKLIDRLQKQMRALHPFKNDL